MAEISLTDAVLIGILLLSLLIGAWRGLVGEMMSLGGWVAAFFSGPLAVCRPRALDAHLAGGC